jgi:hypothetical protein
MANRKFGALADLRRGVGAVEAETTPAATSAREAAAEPAPRPAADAVRAKGRPPGKRSNPEWKLYSHFLKKQTQRRAAAYLAAMEDRRDLSDVLQELLERWLAERA